MRANAGKFTIATTFAVLSVGTLAVTDLPLVPAFAILLLWIASLWLVAQAPPTSAASFDPLPLNDAQMGDLFELSELPVIVTKRDRITVANAAARKLLGDHMVGQDIRIALRHPRAVALIENSESNGATITGLTRRRDVWRINRKLLGDDAAVFELVNRTAEADISRAHTDFVANASHELRTPLASIIGYVETLRESGVTIDEGTRSRFLATIHAEAKRLQALVEDLLSLSRIEAEKHDLPEDTIELTSLIERASRDALGSRDSDRLAFSLTSPLEVCGDEQQLEQLIRNLVDNALKYGAADGSVEIGVAVASGGRAKITVADNGEGIAPEHLPHLTRRFYRTDPGRSRASGGTGLGLAIVKHIVERHRGRLEIASVLNEGTTVTVWLPIADTPNLAPDQGVTEAS